MSKHLGKQEGVTVYYLFVLSAKVTTSATQIRFIRPIFSMISNFTSLQNQLTQENESFAKVKHQDKKIIEVG